MSFTSLSFLFFVAAVCAVYYLFPVRYRWVVLLAASYLFYASQGWQCMVFLLVATVTVYLTAAVVSWMQENTDRVVQEMSGKGVSGEKRKEYKAGRKKRAKHLVTVCIVSNLCILAALMYLNFGIDNLNRITVFLGWGEQVTYRDMILPLGISF